MQSSSSCNWVRQHHPLLFLTFARKLKPPAYEERNLLVIELKYGNNYKVHRRTHGMNKPLPSKSRAGRSIIEERKVPSSRVIATAKKNRKPYHSGPRIQAPVRQWETKKKIMLQFSTRVGGLSNVLINDCNLRLKLLLSDTGGKRWTGRLVSRNSHRSYKEGRVSLFFQLNRRRISSSTFVLGIHQSYCHSLSPGYILVIIP